MNKEHEQLELRSEKEMVTAKKYLDRCISKSPEILRILIQRFDDLSKAFQNLTKKTGIHYIGPTGDILAMLRDLDVSLAYTEEACQVKDTISTVPGSASSMSTSTTAPSASTLSKSASKTSTSTVQATGSGMVLSAIPLPTFCGEIVTYHDFITCFTTIIDTNPCLSEIAKMMYLKNCLSGEALKIIDLIPISAENYGYALKLLADLYDNENACVNIRLNDLIALPPVPFADSIEELRQTYAQLECLILSMQFFGSRQDQNTILKRIYLEKFPESVVSAVVKKSDMPLSDIRKEMLSFIRAKSASDNPASIAAEVSAADEIGSLNLQDVSQPDASGDANSSKNCIFCSGQHWSEDCQAYPTVNERKNAISDRCFKCLRLMHGNMLCCVKIKCAHCNQSSHNRALCPTKFLAGSKTSDYSLENDHYEGTLYTACTTIRNAVKNEEMSIRLILTNIAPVNIISASAAKRLGIKVPHQKHLRLRDLLGNSFTATVEGFQVLLSVVDGPPVPIVVHIIENFETVFPAHDYKDFKKVHPHLSDLVFADMGKGRPVELLLGTEHHDDFLLLPVKNPPKMMVKPGWRLHQSRFGWMVLGRIRVNVYHTSVSFTHDNPEIVEQFSTNYPDNLEAFP